MSLFKCLLVASLISQILPAAQGEAHCPGSVASLNLRLVQAALIIVPVEINGAGPYDFVVDTGAQVTTIDSSLAAELRMKPQGTVGVGGAGTYSRSEAVSIDNLRAGNHSVANTIAVVQIINQLTAVDPRIRGILGGSFLEHFDILIDNGHRILCLDDSGALASSIRGERVALAEPSGENRDLPFTRPIVVTARLSDFGKLPSFFALTRVAIPHSCTGAAQGIGWPQQTRRRCLSAQSVEQNKGLLSLRRRTLRSGKLP